VSALDPDYMAAIAAHLDDESEASLSHAYELGRRALAQGLGLLDVLSLHDAVQTNLVLGAPAADRRRIAAAVSNFFREIQIPYPQIASIDENKWLSTRVTTIWLKTDSAFGEVLRFQPYTRFTLHFWRDHPAVVELRRRVQLANERPSP